MALPPRAPTSPYSAPLPYTHQHKVLQCIIPPQKAGGGAELWCSKVPGKGKGDLFEPQEALQSVHMLDMGGVGDCFQEGSKTAAQIGATKDLNLLLSPLHSSCQAALASAKQPREPRAG